jgi:hypothetical protein
VRFLPFATLFAILLGISSSPGPQAADKDKTPPSGFDLALAQAKKDKKLISVVVYQFG